MRSPAVKLERVRITKVGVWYILTTLVIGVAGANTGNNALYLVEAVMLALLAISGLLSKRNLSRLVLDFDAAPEVHSGQVFSLGVQVSNRDRVLNRRYVAIGGLPETDTLLIPFLGNGESVRERLTFLIKRRGLHRFESLRLTSVFPFGLFEKAMRYPAGLEILVYPEIFPASGLRHFDPFRVGEEPSRRSGWSHELRTLRTFQSGDDPRGIHWKRSARMGELIFMEREAEEGLRLAVLLDNAVGELADPSQVERFERLVSEAASAVVHYLAEGYEVSFASRSGAIPHAGGRFQRQRILAALAVLEPVSRMSRPLWSGRAGAAQLRLGWTEERQASVRFYREKTWLLGLLAFVAPLPLPFNEIVGWPAVIAFCGVAVLFMVRTSRGDNWVLPYWSMNLLGLAYIPFLLGDLSLLRAGRVLQPLVHLALYAMAIKLFAVRKEKEKWHVFLGLFFLFVASMATSVHPAAVFYLLVFGSLAALTMIRFAGLHAVAAVSESAAIEPRVPLRRLLAGMVAASVLAAIPLFFFLPRLRQPYVYLPAGGSGGVVQISGFSDRLDLGSIDRVRSARTVVFRFAYETPPPPLTEMRFKATTYDLYTNGGWRREPDSSANVPRDRDGFFHLSDGFPSSWMKIWLRQGGQQMVLPVETIAVDLPRNGVVLDGAGGARFLLPSPGISEYRIGMALESRVAGWRRDRIRPSELEASSVSARMAGLAATVMGSGDPEERIRHLERYLRSEFRYSLDSVNRGPDPIESFLFDTKEGHCEYFASAMVLLLRSQGIAARLVTGYLGSDYNPLEEYFIVRQSNAHAWVEAFVLDEEAEAAVSNGSDSGGVRSGRWVIFDPTPAEARPQSGREGIVTLITQAYDYLLFRWDRYVLTYGFADQVDVFIGLREAWLKFWQAVTSSGDELGSSPPNLVEDVSPDSNESVPQESKRASSRIWQVAPFLVLLLALGFWFYLRRGRFSATHAYRSLRARATSQVEGIPVWVGPLRLEERLSEQRPDAAQETHVIISHYVRESFAGEELTPSQLDAVRAAWTSAKKKLRKSA